MAIGQCVQPGQKSFGHLEISADYGRCQTESLPGFHPKQLYWSVVDLQTTAI